MLFYSQAPNLVPDAAGKPADLYIKNLATGAITRSNAFGADQESAAPREYAFSADGSTVLTDIGTIKNLATGALTRTRTDTIFSSPTRSPDGTRALFWRNANTALPGDPEYGAYMLDLFVEDMATGASVRVNTAADGTPATNSGGSRYDTFSPDGTRVLFTSDATATQTLLATAPPEALKSLGRTLRPIARLLGVTLPPELQRPPKPPRPKPTKPPKPPLPKLLPLHPQRHPRDYPFLRFGQKTNPA